MALPLVEAPSLKRGVPMKEEVVRWLASSAHPIESLRPGSSYGDLLPLQHLWHQARVVGLGEATHGTSEFFTMKDRLVRFLVEEMGFTVFALEASLAASRALNRYVLGGDGDAKALLRDLGFWTWSTMEVRELVEWMRVYNSKASRDRQVHFVGFDVQGVASGVRDLLTFLSVVAPAFSREHESLLIGALAVLTPGSDPKPREQHEQESVLGALLGVVGFLTEHRTSFAEQTSVGEVDEAIALAKNLARSYDTYAIPSANRTEKRDRYMAETIHEQVTAGGNGSRMIVWAHNGHLASQRFNGHASMGTHLRRMLGSEYYVVGFAFNRGSFWARAGYGGSLTRFTVSDAPADSLEWYCATAGLGNAFIDLKEAPRSSEVEHWIAGPIPMRSTGAVVFAENPEIQAWVELDSYDAFVYLPDATCTHPSM